MSAPLLRRAASSPAACAACAAALAALPGIGPATLHRLLASADPVAVWDGVRSGDITRPSAPRRAAGPSWAAAAAAVDVEAQWSSWAARGIAVTWWGGPHYPPRLVTDPEPPGVLFSMGDPGGLDGPTVAVVGTRRCTPEGRSGAYHLGRELSAAGVCVVSGLALGIDGATHLGALDGRTAASRAAGTVGVAASGVDVVYPSRHAGLWARVGAVGAILSETPPGRPAQAWRFPSRNRVIAGLADLVVVVESHAAGGSLLTADAALARGIEVRAFPGPVVSPASAGSNQLLHDGAGPVRDATDVLDALGIVQDRPSRAGRRRPTPPAPGHPHRGEAAGEGARWRGVPGGPPPSGGAAATGAPVGRPAQAPTGPDVGGGAGRSAVDVAVLDAVGWRATSMARIVARTRLPVGDVARALDRLAEDRAVRDDSGWWTRTSAR